MLQKYEITVVKPCEKTLKYPQFGGNYLKDLSVQCANKIIKLYYISSSVDSLDYNVLDYKKYLEKLSIAKQSVF